MKEEIREYWSRRADTFDQSPFHGMQAPGEKTAWLELIGRHVAALAGSDVLELAFGTGEITTVLLALGFRVTGLDLTEAMLRKAKAKHAGAADLSLFLGDAEDTREGDESHDAIVMRHLVWTLIDPITAFRDWYRVVRPGGRIVIIDGDFAETSFVKRWRRKLSQWMEKLEGAKGPVIDWAAHEAIMRQIFFSRGLKPGVLQSMLAEAGFIDFKIEGLGSIRKAQLRGASLSARLKTGISDSFILSCAKPR